MTPTELRNAAAVMLAASEGKKIEISDRHPDPRMPDFWSGVIEPSWDWKTYKYRIAPEPRRVWLSWDAAGQFWVSVPEGMKGATEFVEVMKT